MLWGLTLSESAETTELKVFSPIHLSMAVLDLGTSYDNHMSIVQVWCALNRERYYLLCTLNKDGISQCALHLDFVIGSLVTFRTCGDTDVHLTGYLACRVPIIVNGYNPVGDEKENAGRALIEPTVVFSQHFCFVQPDVDVVKKKLESATSNLEKEGGEEKEKGEKEQADHTSVQQMEPSTSTAEEAKPNESSSKQCSENSGMKECAETTERFCNGVRYITNNNPNIECINIPNVPRITPDEPITFNSSLSASSLIIITDDEEIKQEDNQDTKREEKKRELPSPVEGTSSPSHEPTVKKTKTLPKK